MFEKAGFSTNKHRLHLYKLIFFPLLLAGMAILGISFNLNTISKKPLNLGLFYMIIVGFIIFYFTKLISALSNIRKNWFSFISIFAFITSNFFALLFIITS